MKWIVNTDLFAMRGRYANASDLKSPQKTLADVASFTSSEGDLVVGDPTLFLRDDPNNEFDLGWDLEGDEVFVGMRR